MKFLSVAAVVATAACSGVSGQIIDLPTEIFQDVNKGIAPTVNVIADPSSDGEGREILKSIRLAHSHGGAFRGSFLQASPGALGGDASASGSGSGASAASTGGASDSGAGTDGASLAGSLRVLMNEASRLASGSVGLSDGRSGSADGAGGSAAGSLANLLSSTSAGSASEQGIRKTLMNAQMTHMEAANVNETPEVREVLGSIRAAMRTPSRVGTWSMPTEGDSSAGAQ